MYRRRTKGKTIRECRREIQQQALVRGLFLNMTTRAIAKQLKLTPQTIRDWTALPEIQGALADYSREQFEALDRRFPYGMKLAMDQLIRQLKRGDWKAVERMLADTGILGRMMEHYLATVERSGVPHPERILNGVIPADDMTPEQRDLARQLMQSVRKSQGPRQIAPGMTRPES